MIFKLSSLLTAGLYLAGAANAACGDGSTQGEVTGSGTFTSRVNGATVYSGTDYRLAIQTALDRIGSGQRVVVRSSGSIGANTITITSGKTFEVCGTLNVGNRSGRGAIEVTDQNDVKIPYLTMTGNPYFGLRFSGTRNLNLGEITLNLSGGLGIRFDRDRAQNYNVRMGTIRVTGAGSHAVETWNIDGLNIGSVIARNVGESGLLLQKTINARIGYVEGNNVGSGTGYATLRMANNNGQLANGQYTTTNVFIDRVYSRGGGRGIFCVSMSGAAEIKYIDLASNGNNAVLIENCYNLAVRDGVINGGGEVRVSSRAEFPNTSGIFFEVQVDNTSVRESPCADNIFWGLTGNGRRTLC
ncbi:parallel beta-helix repeat-containing [Paramyrothecium foliicola]|nr:parallel beta-helix repeat-containing [Paramyrothecium foliicola]